MASSMRRIGKAAAVAIAMLPSIAFADGTLNVQKMASYDKNLSVPQAVKTECMLESKIPEFVEAAAKGQFDSVNLVNQVPNGGKNLTMKIVGINATGGGAWSGPKSVTIEGKLHDKGKVVGTFKATRYSGGGAFGAYKGTCSILNRCAKTLGEDVARWLQDPVDGARLGDSK